MDADVLLYECVYIDGYLTGYEAYPGFDHT